ncbi:MAG: hypothetical protein DI605_13015 [Sphingomonas sp.]|nr:MAG: hypothetical protein DI605_13015 [Sphingomonas sp.]
MLNFTPSDTGQGGGANNPINFQNAGTQVIYQSTPGGPNFTVLNRIVPSDPGRPIAFNGTVTSQLVSAANVTSRGGSVWFYSPGGIILGDGSVFDVGSLLLSTADPTGGTGTIGNTTTFSLNSSASPNGIINVLSQATINATNTNSYVAIVAPNVLQRGTINVNGAAAFVAAETALLSFDQGLFQITVGVGGGTAADPFPLQLRGTVRLDRSSGAATDNRGIYAVAVPKNTAISMIVAPDGYYGFDVAQGATFQNGGVYLVAGGNLSVDPLALTPGKINALPTIGGASISIEGSAITPAPASGGRFNAPVSARASDTIDVANFSSLSGQTSPIAFLSDLAIFGGTSSTLSVANGTINIGGNLDIQSFGLNGNLGTSLLSATAGGTVTITGSTQVRAAVPNGINYTQGLYDFSTGGTARVDINGGTVQTGRLSVGADGRGENGQVTQGGAATVTVNNGTLRADTSIDLYAAALSANRTATGGTATLDVANGTVQTGTSLTVGAGGFGGPASDGAGGTAQMIVHSGGGITAGGLVQISADAQGGAATGVGSGGTATGGTAILTMDQTSGPITSLATTGDLDIQATAQGGQGGSGANSAGGAATGGNVTVTIGSGAQLTANTGFFSTFGYGGTSAGGGTGGTGTGGIITADSAGILDFALLSLSSDAMGGDKTGGTGNAGDALSGRAVLRVRGGSLTATRATGNASLTPGVVVGIQAIGGSVTGGTGSGGTGVAGGGVPGLGSAIISVFNDATVTATRLGAFANGTGGAGLGAGAMGGLGRAANASILTQSDGAMQIGSITARSDGTGGASPGGTGGDGSASFAEYNSAPASGATSATMISGTVDLSANGTGGNGLTGGAATASLVSFRESSSTQETRIAGAVSLSSLATGGSGTGGNGGSAQGSTINVQADRSIAIGGTLTATANAIGGSASGASFNGGQATGGSVNLIAAGGDLAVTGDTALSADARSGSSASGRAGDATGGNLSLNANGGRLTLAGTGTLSATAFGGVSSGDGGNATGGNARIITEPDTDTGAEDGTISTGLLSVNINANASQLQNQGRIGGAATGGNFTLLADTGAITIGDLSVSAGAGGYGGSDPTTTTMRGGTALFEARSADITLASATISAVGQAATTFNSNPPAGPGDSIGGSVTLRAAAGRTFTVTNIFLAAVDAVSGRSSLDTQAGAGIAGQIMVVATGSIVGGGLDLRASGFGGNTFGTSTGAGGEGRGGSIDISVTGLLDMSQGIGATADGRAGNPIIGVGGNGIGGLARLRAFEGGVVRTGGISLTANGTGTSGTSGGAGIGGRTVGTQLGGAYLIADDGTITGSGGFIVTANGYGGGAGGIGGVGGAGTGGQAWIIGMNGTVDFSSGSSLSQLQAIGSGGGAFFATPSGSAGGTGTGGQLLVGQSSTGANQDAISVSTGRILLGDTYLDATGQGGSGGQGVAGGTGGAGGTGIGGTAEVSADTTFGVIAANAGSTLSIAVGGTGGQGGVGGDPDGSGVTGAGGIGGTGTGGTAFVGTREIASSSNAAGGSATFADVALDAEGIGGTGGDGATVVGAGGAGRGGTLTFASAGAPVTAGNIAFLVGGTGGDGGQDAAGGTGTGGEGRGGTTAVSVASRTDGSSRGSLMQTGTIAADTTGASNGGASIAGTSSLDVISGDANIGLYFVTSAGTTPSLAGPSRINVRDGLLTAAGLNIEAVGDLSLTTGAGGRMNIGTAILQATRSITFGDGTTSSNVPGAITVSGDLSVIVGADYTLGTGSAVGGNYLVSAGGAISTQGIQAGGSILFAANGDVTIGDASSGNGIVALASRTGSVTAGTLAGQNVVLLAARNAAAGGITTAATGTALISNIGLVSTAPASGMLGATGTFDPGFDYATLAGYTPQRLAGTATITGATRAGNFLVAAESGFSAGSLDIGSRLLIDSGTTIALGNVTIPAALSLQADGAITTGTIASQGAVSLLSRTAQIATGAIQAGGNVALLARTGIGTAGITASTTSGTYVLLADAANAGAIDIAGTVTALNGPISASGPITADIVRAASSGTASFAAITGASTVRLQAADLSFAGAILGNDIALASGNVRIGANGSIGNANTRTIAFTITGGGPAFLGGTTDGAGYTLDNSEISRIRAGTISLIAGSDGAGGPALTVRDASFTGSANANGGSLTGASGSLTLSATGTISVVGNLALTDAGSGQSLLLNAGLVRLTTDAGSIGVLSGGAPGGRLAISARRIEAASAQLLGANAGFTGTLSSTTTAAIGAAATQPRAEGYIQAGRIELSANDDIIIQNSGTAALAAGFTAGAGGLAITNLGGAGSGGFNVLIYGRIQGASGFLTNADTLGAVNFASAENNSLAGYSAQSVVNGCPILGTGCMMSAPETPPIAAIVRDVIDGNLIAFSRETVFLPVFDQPAAIDLTILQAPAIITDPVASAGNAIMWESAGAPRAGPPAGPATGKKQNDEERQPSGARQEQRP